jgi:hypothetical protein
MIDEVVVFGLAILYYISDYEKHDGDECSCGGLTLSNPIFLPTAYSPALICFER